MIKYSTGCGGLQKYFPGLNLYKGICATKCVCQIFWISEANGFLRWKWASAISTGLDFASRLPFIRVLHIIEEQQLQQCYCWHSYRKTPLAHELQAGIIPYIRSHLYVCTRKILSKLHLGNSSDLLIPDTGYPMSLLKCLASSWQTWYSCYTLLRCSQRILEGCSYILTDISFSAPYPQSILNALVCMCPCGGVDKLMRNILLHAMVNSIKKMCLRI